MDDLTLMTHTFSETVIKVEITQRKLGTCTELQLLQITPLHHPLTLIILHTKIPMQIIIPQELSHPIPQSIDNPSSNRHHIMTLFLVDLVGKKCDCLPTFSLKKKSSSFCYKTTDQKQPS